MCFKGHTPWRFKLAWKQRECASVSSCKLCFSVSISRSIFCFEFDFMGAQPCSQADLVNWQQRGVRVTLCVCMWVEASQIVDPAFSSCFLAEKFSVNSQPLPFSTSKAVQQQRFSLHGATLSFPPCSTKQHHRHFAHISTPLCFYCLGFCRGHLPYHCMDALL